jgi:hypothetical protein
MLASDFASKTLEEAWQTMVNVVDARTYRTVEELRPALLEFKCIYNEQWIMERMGYRTPA